MTSPATPSAGTPGERQTQRLLQGIASRAHSAQYFVDHFVLERLSVLPKNADFTGIQELFDTILGWSLNIPAEEWLAALEPGKKEEPPPVPASPAPVPEAPALASPPPDAASAKSVPAPEEDASVPSPDAVAAELLRSMSLADAIHTETAVIYDLAKSKDDLAEQREVLQEKLQARTADADAAATVESLQKDMEKKDILIERHRSVRALLQDQMGRTEAQEQAAA